MQDQSPRQNGVNPEELANWFLRLDGFFTIPNFVVHPTEGGRPQRTDADVLAIRYPDRVEVVGGKPLQDDSRFLAAAPLFVIAEVKAGKCRLNGPWTRPADRNVHLVLQAAGIVRASEIEPMARALYEQKRFKSANVNAILTCFGAEADASLGAGVLQISWAEVAEFIFRRYKRYQSAKRDHQQWPKVGRVLWELAVSVSESDFCGRLCDAIRMRPA